MSQKTGETVPARRLASCGDVTCEFLVNPIPRPEPEPISIVLKPRERRVTFVDHRKPNSTAILTLAQEILRERGVEVAEEILFKGDASTPMSGPMLAKLAGEPGLVLCGVSD